MPTYVYECSACCSTFEVEQRIVEDALKDCTCGSKGTMKRIIQPIAVMFKGSGFYVNDSKSTPAPAAKTEASTTPAPAETNAEITATPPTPAATPEPAKE